MSSTPAGSSSASPSSFDPSAALPPLVPLDAASDDTRLFAMLLAPCTTPERVLRLGLSGQSLTDLLRRHFAPVPPAWRALAAALPTPAWAANDTFVIELRELLRRRADTARHPVDVANVASILSTACLRPDHLWRDLGLRGRDEVTALLTHFFPEVAAENTANLRWKRYLAEARAKAYGYEPGPAPGCPGCEDFGFCFAHLAPRGPGDRAP